MDDDIIRCPKCHGPWSTHSNSADMLTVVCPAPTRPPNDDREALLRKAWGTLNGGKWIDDPLDRTRHLLNEYDRLYGLVAELNVRLHAADDATDQRNAEHAKRAALVEATRAFTVDAPNDQPSGEAERQIDAMLRLLSLERWPWSVRHMITELNDTMAKLCEASANDAQRLRLAAEAFSGGDFGSDPSASIPDPDAAILMAHRKDIVEALGPVARVIDDYDDD